MPVTNSPTRILVVEDDAAVGDLLSKFFQRLGFEPILARDGAAAWEMFENNSNAFDLVLTDLQLPGISGFELVRRIRQLPSSVKIVVLSGDLSPRDIDRLYDMQVDELIVKPLQFSELGKRIQRLMQ